MPVVAWFRAVPTLLLTTLLTGCAAFGAYGGESGAGFGLRGNLPLGRVLSPESGVGNATVSRLELAGSLQRFQPEGTVYTEGTLDLLLPLVALGDGAARTYVGAGVHLGRFSPEVGESRTEAGASILGGLRFDRRALAPFAEVRASTGGYDQLSVLVGLQLFGGMF